MEHTAKSLAEHGLGLDYGQVELREHDSRWRYHGQLLVNEVTAALKPLEPSVQVEHVGSTSVPGLLAKPMIDLIVGIDDFPNIREVRREDRVARFKRVQAIKAALDQAGWRYICDLGGSGGRLFALEPRVKHAVAHLHLVENGSPHWQTYVDFRELLRSNPDARAMYQALKLDLQAQHSDDRRSYTAGKHDLIESLLGN